MNNLKDRVLQKYGIAKDADENTQRKIMIRFIKNLHSGLFYGIKEFFTGFNPKPMSRKQIAQRLIEMRIASNIEEARQLTIEAVSEKYVEPYKGNRANWNYFYFELVRNENDRTHQLRSRRVPRYWQISKDLGTKISE